MENRNDVRLITTVPMVSLPATPGQAVLSVKGSLHQIVKEVRGLNASYRSAVREFQERYIVALLIKHACHLGKTAEDFGMHRNTLTRIIRKLKIDPKEIRRLTRARTIDHTSLRSYAHLAWQHPGESVKRNSELHGSRPNIGATAGA
jgi:Fis family transcriptional regulator